METVQLKKRGKRKTRGGRRGECSRCRRGRRRLDYEEEVVKDAGVEKATM